MPQTTNDSYWEQEIVIKWLNQYHSLEFSKRKRWGDLKTAFTPNMRLKFHIFKQFLMVKNLNILH
jgi:hypothetical protein